MSESPISFLAGPGVLPRRLPPTLPPATHPHRCLCPSWSGLHVAITGGKYPAELPLGAPSSGLVVPEPFPRVGVVGAEPSTLQHGSDRQGGAQPSPHPAPVSMPSSPERSAGRQATSGTVGFQWPRLPQGVGKRQRMRLGQACWGRPEAQPFHIGPGGADLRRGLRDLCVPVGGCGRHGAPVEGCRGLGGCADGGRSCTRDWRPWFGRPSRPSLCPWSWRPRKARVDAAQTR